MRDTGSGFDICRNFGEDGERNIARLLNLNQAEIEVKRDCWTCKTGNVAVEFLNNNGTPSGIATTTARFWIFIAENPKEADSPFIAVSTSKVRKAALEHSIRVVQSDEGARSYLVPVQFLLLD